MNDPTSRRGALKCLGMGAGTLFLLSGGVFEAVDLARAAEQKKTGTPLFLQISDTHIGFNKEANPDVAGTLNRSIDIAECDAAASCLRHPHRRHHPSLQGGGIRHGGPAALAAEGGRNPCRARRA